MKLYGTEINKVILEEIGRRLKDKRIAMNMKQSELAIESGVSLRTIIKVESGSNISMNHILSILRVLRIAANIDLLIPEVKPNPIEILTLGNKRRRASSNKQVVDSQWKWGDEK